MRTGPWCSGDRNVTWVLATAREQIAEPNLHVGQVVQECGAESGVSLASGSARARSPPVTPTSTANRGTTPEVTSRMQSWPKAGLICLLTTDLWVRCVPVDQP